MRRIAGRLGQFAAATAALAVVAGTLTPAAGAAVGTIFGSGTPATVDSGDGSSVELGVKFSSEVAGSVTGVRFYKAAANSGTHVGSLWASSGTLLASATFSGETASGWQQVSFSKPVAIAANTTYVAGYFAPKGHYSDTSSGFASAGVSSPPLLALANSVSPNGVYSYSGASTFPTGSYKATNYWVDVLFEPGSVSAPGQVTGVSAAAGNGSANVSWTAPSNGGSTITKYTITPYIGSEAQAATVVQGSPPATSATVTGLANGTSYTFTVTATNSIGTGPPSEHSNAVTPAAPTAPGPPAGVSATAGNGSASVSWAAPSNGGSTITKYTITPYIGSEAQTASTVNGTPPATSATVTGLSNGTAYTFTVTATNSIGTGPPSEHSNTITPVASQNIFGNTTPVTVDSGDGSSVELGVKFSSEVAGSVTGVRFYKAAANSGTHVGSLWASSGTLLASATFSGETASGWQQVSFSKPVAIAANTTYVAGYFAPKGHYSDTSSGFASAGVSSPPLLALANSVSPNGVYSYSGASTFPTGSYKATNYWVDVLFEPGSVSAPGQVTGVSAAAGNGSANVSWTAPSNGGSTITKYTITPYIGSEAQAATVVQGSPPATSATVTGLANGTSYTFTVTATNSIGTGPPSEHSNAVTPAAPTAPGPPAGVSATAGNGSASVSWAAPSNGGSTITKYTITPYIGSEAQTASTVNGTPPATSATVTGLSNGTAYTFTVTATNSIGTGPPSEHSNTITPVTTPIAYPDLQVLMPQSEIYVIQGGGSRTLEFTHITEDAGAGPLEIRPAYNPSTGIAQGYQALYTMPSPGVWKFDHTVPIVGPMVWVAPGDYRFPLDRFWLYGVAGGGGPGALVASSPKSEFCMTSDVYVGGVPNAPAQNTYPSYECANPEGVLGLTVGWGDQYDASDGGEGIDISSLPNGTYWLRGEVDPSHYLQESNTANDITDTKLRIEGASATVLEQTHPSSTPPTVTLTSPATGANVSGSVSLTATASGGAPITSVQFLLDGQPIGAPVSAPPYTFNWAVGSTPLGSHFLSAQATDANGFVGTAADVPVTVGESGGGGSDHEPPTVAIVNPAAGQQLSGSVPVTANASDNVAVSSVQFYLDGKALGAGVTKPPYAISWDTTAAGNGSHTLTATATDSSGNTGTSAPVGVTVQNPAEPGPCFVMDANVTAHGLGTVKSPAFTTAEGGEQLLALVGVDGPGGAGRQSTTISGAGLAWKLVARANSRSGDAEIWTATAPAALSNATVTSTPAVGGYDQSLSVISMQMSMGVGASAVGGRSERSAHGLPADDRSGLARFRRRQRLRQRDPADARTQPGAAPRIPRRQWRHVLVPVHGPHHGPGRGNGDAQRHRADERSVEPRGGRAARRRPGLLAAAGAGACPRPAAAIATAHRLRWAVVSVEVARGRRVGLYGSADARSNRTPWRPRGARPGACAVASGCRDAARRGHAARHLHLADTGDIERDGEPERRRSHRMLFRIRHARVASVASSVHALPRSRRCSGGGFRDGTGARTEQPVRVPPRRHERGRRRSRRLRIVHDAG